MGIAIVRTEWSGTSGGPGLTQMCIDAFIPITTAQAQAWVDAVRAFWLAQAALLPNELTLTVSPAVDFYVTETGELDGTTIAATAPAAVLGSSAATYSGGAGYKVTWETNQVKNGRRVRGNTYVVPAAGGVFTATGTVSSAAQTTVNNAAATLIAAIEEPAVNLSVWSRPKEIPVVRAGDSTPVVIGQCSTKSAILRSRRD